MVTISSGSQAIKLCKPTSDLNILFPNVPEEIAGIDSTKEKLLVL